MNLPFFKTSPIKQIQDTSKLFDEQSFYRQFIKDLTTAKTEVIIESPFITTERMKMFIPIFEALVKRHVTVYIMTRDPKEHTQPYTEQSEAAIRYFERIGVQVLICTGGHHRKLAIIDRNLLWEGSLNILSQGHSREIMRRIAGERSAVEMFDFLHLERYILNH